VYRVITADQARDAIAAFSDPVISLDDFYGCRLCGDVATFQATISPPHSPRLGATTHSSTVTMVEKRVSTLKLSSFWFYVISVSRLPRPHVAVIESTLQSGSVRVDHAQVLPHGVDRMPLTVHGVAIGGAHSPPTP
jgi:hypothetical protein